MILTTIYEYKKAFLPKALELAIEETLALLASNNNTLEIGAYELSNKAKALVSQYETKAYEDCAYETHNIYADIQMLISGEEFIDIRTTNEGLTPNDSHSDSRNDLILYHEKPIEFARVRLMPEILCIIPPNEVHAPSICIEKSSNVHKIVIKVPM